MQNRGNFIKGVKMRHNFFVQAICSALLIAGLGINAAKATDWPNWRGPNQNGASLETGLISTWSLNGENLAWKADFIGRSTPVIMNGACMSSVAPVRA
jgi:hypothetical protein